MARTCGAASLSAGAIAGAAIVPLARSTNGFAVERHERLLRPPGALDEGYFLERCIRCGECMKVCPNNALHPTLTEAGLEGLWTPVLVPRTGYCEASCVLCSQVCPTGAIWEITPREKGWTVELRRGHQTNQAGTGFLRSRTLPALGNGYRMHRLRGVVPNLSQGHLPSSGRGRGREGKRASRSSSHTSIPVCAWAVARVNMRVRCRTGRRFTSPASARAVREPTRSC